MSGVRTATVAVALAALAAGAWTEQIAFVAIAVAALLVVAIGFNRTGRLTALFTPLIGRPAEIKVWGAPLPTVPGATTTLQSTRALGAGIHLYLQVEGQRRPLHIKIAQPDGARADEGSVVISGAEYVQCAGTNMARASHAPAVEVSLVGPA